MVLRPANLDDVRLLWEWANAPILRKVAFNTAPIPWETHVDWLQRKLADPSCRILIAEWPDGTPLGVVRFEAESDEAVISVSVAEEFCGRGLGAELIRRGTAAYLSEADVRCVRAFIKPDNAASLRAFEAAGYQPAGEVSHKGQPARLLIVQRFSQRDCE